MDTYITQRLADGITLRTFKAGKGSIAQLTADSLPSLVRYLRSDEGKPKGAFKGDAHSRTNKATKSWDLSAGWEGACKFATDGWPEGRKRLAKALARLPQATGVAPIREDDVAGGVLDCAAFVAGDPCHYDCDPEETHGQTKVIRILAPIGAAWCVDAESIANRGAAIASVVDAIEASGLQCEVDAVKVHANATDSFQFECRWRVKSAGEHLNLDFLAYSLGHPAVARRIGFASLESQGGLKVNGHSPDDISGGYGYSHNPLSAQHEPAGTVVFPSQGSGGDYSTPEAAKKTINAVFEKAGYRVDYAD
jgi:hypothetical protein